MGSHRHAHPLQDILGPDWTPPANDTDFDRWGNDAAQDRICWSNDAPSILDVMPLSSLEPVGHGPGPAATPETDRTRPSGQPLSGGAGSLSKVGKTRTDTWGPVRRGPPTTPGAEGRIESGVESKVGSTSGSVTGRRESGTYGKVSSSPTGGSVTVGQRGGQPGDEADDSVTLSKQGEFYGMSVAFGTTGHGGKDYDPSENTSDMSIKFSGSSDGDDYKFGFSATTGTGKNAHGASVYTNSETDEKGGSMTYRGATLGFTYMPGGFAAGLGYKDYGATAMYQDAPGIFRVGAQIGLGKHVQLGGAYSRGDEGYDAQANANLFGFGGGLGFGEWHTHNASFVPEGMGSAFAGHAYDHHTRTEGSRRHLDLGIGVAGLGSADSMSTSTSVLQRRPADYDSWSEARKRHYQATLSTGPLGMNRPEDIKLDELKSGTGFGFQQRRDQSFSGSVGPDIGIAALKGKVTKGTTDSTGIQVTNLGPSFLFSETRGSAKTTGVDAAVGLGVRYDGKGTHTKGSSTRHDYSVDKDVQHLGQTRLTEGLVPGALHQDLSDPEGQGLYIGYCAAVQNVARYEKLLADEPGNPDLETRLAQAKTELGRVGGALSRRKLANTEVGEELTDGVRLQRRVTTEHESTDMERSTSLLFWELTNAKRSRSRTLTTSDFVAHDDTIRRTQGLHSERQEDDDPSESLSLTTSNDTKGPAFSFTTKADMTRTEQIDQASGKSLTVPAGYSGGPFDRSKEQLTTSVTLGHEETRKIADLMNDDEHRETTWKAMSERMASGDAASKVLLDVTSPEAFKKLSPEDQERWVLALHEATLKSKTGNVFEAIAAIELIDDVELRRKVYARVLEDADKQGADKVLGGDLGAEFLAFSKTLAKQGLDLDAKSRVTATNDASDALSNVEDPVSVFKMSPSAWMSRGLLRNAHRKGGSGAAEDLIRKAGWSAGDVYAKLTDTESDQAWMGHLLEGTVLGARVQHLRKRLNPVDPDDDGHTYTIGPDISVVYKEMMAIDQPDEKKSTDVHTKRAQAIKRSLDVAGGESQVVDTLVEAWKQGPEALQKVIRASGITPAQFDRITTKQGVMLPFTV